MADPAPITDPQSQSSMPKGASVNSVENSEVGGGEDNQRILARQVPSGTSRGVQQLGGPSLYADSGNKQIVVNDDIDRVLMGNQPNFGEGFYVTRSGINVLTATKPEDFIFNSNQNVFKIVKSATYTLVATAATSSVYTLPHDLGYTPVAIVYLNFGINNSAPLPTWASININTVDIVVEFQSFYDFYCDEKNVYIEFFNATGTPIGNYPVTYYILQETAKITEN